MQHREHREFVADLVKQFNERVEHDKYSKRTIVLSEEPDRDSYLLMYDTTKIRLAFQEGATSSRLSYIVDRWHFTLYLAEHIKLPLEDPRATMNLLQEASGHEYVGYRADHDPQVSAVWIQYIYRVVPAKWLDALCLQGVLKGLLSKQYLLYRAGAGSPLHDHYAESLDLLQRTQRRVEPNE